MTTTSLTDGLQDAASQAQARIDFVPRKARDAPTFWEPTRIVETNEILCGEAMEMPKWWFVFSMAFPWGGLGLAFYYSPVGERSLLIACAIMGVFATAALLGILSYVNHLARRQGAWFVLDKFRRTLSLPQANVVLEAEQVREFVEVHGWRKNHAGLKEWECELSVVAVDDAGQLQRYPVISRDWSVDRVAKVLASTFRVPRRVVKYRKHWFRQTEPSVHVIE